MSNGRSILLLETKSSKPVKLKVARRNKTSVSWLLGVIVKKPPALLPLDSGTLVFWPWRRKHHVIVSDSKHVLHFVSQNFILSGYCLPVAAVNLQ